MSKMCDFCGQEKAEFEIENPNGWDEKQPTWNVCKDCNDTIPQLHKLAYEKALKHMLGGMKNE